MCNSCCSMKVRSKKDAGAQVCGITTLLSIQVTNPINLTFLILCRYLFIYNHNLFLQYFLLNILNVTLLTIFIERTNNDNAVVAVDFYHRYKVSKYEYITIINYELYICRNITHAYTHTILI